MKPSMPPTDESAHVRKMELLISVILRGGVAFSLVIVVIGLVLSFIHHPAYLNSPALLGQITARDRIVPHGLREVGAGVGQLRGESVIAVGLLALIATPVLRVAVSIFGFAIEREWIFTLVTLFVLAMLVLSFFLGSVEG